jgi:hypothetical protein
VIAGMACKPIRPHLIRSSINFVESDGNARYEIRQQRPSLQANGQEPDIHGLSKRRAKCNCSQDLG